MTTTYLECPQCGKRALSVATRCPHCGVDFPPRPLHRPNTAAPFGRSVPAIAAAGIALALVLAAALVRRPSTAPRPAPGSTAADSVTTATPGPAPAPASETPVSTPATPPRPPPSGARASTRRYARTWANVRGDRTRSAPAVGRLNPGDSVQVDSLSRGWYRVLVEGRTIGYVHRSTLADAPPE